MSGRPADRPVLRIENLHVYYGAIHALQGVGLESHHLE